MSKFKQVIRGVVIAALLIVIAAVSLVLYVQRHGHPEARVSDLIPNAAKAVVQPWNVPAQEMVPKMFTPENRKIVAASIQGTAHPTGKNPQMQSIDARPNGDGISVRFEISWQGGISSSSYKTVVVWECSQSAHGRAVVTGDEAPIRIDNANAQKLDDYFRTEIYPMLCKNLQ